MRVGFFVYNKVFTVPRPRVVLRDDVGRVLLVRHWGSWRTWSLPGGGAKRGETIEMAAQRELWEELGLTVDVSQLRHLATVAADYVAPIFILSISPAEIPEQPYNRAEIAAVQWCHLDALPPHLTQVARKALAVLAKQG